jgi:CRISPR-associated protein Csx17
MPDLPLNGCAPIPLAHYLKALGILRLVSEQVDPTATAFWKDDRFFLNSTLDRDELTDFFLNTYKPTAVLAPWNGGGGFYFREGKSKEKDEATGKLRKTGLRDQQTSATKTVAAIVESRCERMEPLRETIEKSKTVLASMGLNEAPKEELKEVLLNRLRNVLPDEAIGWMDATIILGTSKVGYPPLLGTGGTDGALDFTNNFMQRINEVINSTTGLPSTESPAWLRSALFSEPSPGNSTKSPIGQFFPGAAGGANATSGFDAPSTVNPWDFILMIEGAVLFAAASVKKLDSLGSGALIYPFCVRQAAVGYASAAGADEVDARCEMWMPMWDRPVSLMELRSIFGEGRAQVRGRPARTGVDFSQAVVTLGVDRGIASFQRFGFQIRNGLAYFATPLARIPVRRQIRADLLADIEVWHDRLRQKAAPSANSNAPASVTRALQQLERRMIELCRDGGSGTLQAVLAALGAAERSIAHSFRWTGENHIQPLRGLSARWISDANDGSLEFRLALSLASIRAPLGRETFWLRQNLEPVDIGFTKDRAWTKWADLPGNDVVWQDGHFTDALHSILRRRIIRFEKAGMSGWADVAARFAYLDDITAFIEGRVNEDLLADLLWGLACVDPKALSMLPEAPPAGLQRPRVSPGGAEQYVVPSAFYALLKLCHHRLPRDEDPIPLVPAILNRAMSGDGTAASQLASRRLNASGRRPLVRELPVTGVTARRTAAAIIFPISHQDFSRLEKAITHQTETNP